MSDSDVLKDLLRDSLSYHIYLILEWANQLQIPLGRFSESAVKYRNKDGRKARLKFSRKK